MLNSQLGLFQVGYGVKMPDYSHDFVLSIQDSCWTGGKACLAMPRGALVQVGVGVIQTLSLSSRACTLLRSAMC